MFLDKMLQSQGFGTRKHCQQLIKNGAISIHDEIQTNPKLQVDVKDLDFLVSGQECTYREKVYIALYKPQGFECSHQPQHYPSVFSLFPNHLRERGLVAVGRLDQDSTGLLLLTDDGKFSHALTHPKRHVPKVYHVTTVNPVSQEQLATLAKGVKLHNEEGVFAATDVYLMSEYQVSLTIHQGVYHQVKRMLAAVGNKVQALHRQKIGQLDLPELESKEWIYLNDEQIQAVQQSASH